MLPIRITLAGCSTMSVIEGSSPSASPVGASNAEAGTSPIGWPSGPITTTFCSCSLMGLR